MYCPVYNCITFHVSLNDVPCCDRGGDGQWRDELGHHGDGGGRDQLDLDFPVCLSVCLLFVLCVGEDPSVSSI